MLLTIQTDLFWRKSQYSAHDDIHTLVAMNNYQLVISVSKLTYIKAYMEALRHFYDIRRLKYGYIHISYINGTLH